MNRKEINLLNDAMFKALFRSEEARDIIANVISILLGIDKEKLIYAEYNSGELVKNKLFEKGKVCDIIIKIDNDNKIILEMNGSLNNNIFDKNATYSFTIINEGIRKVENLHTNSDFVGYQTNKEAHKQDLSDSYETGYDDGVTKRNIEIAKAMLQDTNNYEAISKYTGLSIEEIKNIQ